MKVKELILELSKLNPDDDVFVRESHTYLYESDIAGLYESETGPYLLVGNSIRDTERMATEDAI